MSWSREGDEIVLRMSEETWERLLLALGIAAGAAFHDRRWRRDQLQLVNKLNEGNPRFTPCEVPEDEATQ